MPRRVVVFIDAQNTYQGARRAFFESYEPHIKGQFHPHLLARLLAQRGRPADERELTQVRIYSGRPDATKQPKTYAAHMKQSAYWEVQGVRVVTRTLLYPRNWPQEREREKGIDVGLATDFVALAIEGAYDIGILVSSDTDMVPALELVARRFSPSVTVEVAAWRSDRLRRRLSVAGFNVWCHWLDIAAYHSVADGTDYNV